MKPQEIVAFRGEVFAELVRRYRAWSQDSISAGMHLNVISTLCLVHKACVDALQPCPETIDVIGLVQTLEAVKGFARSIKGENFTEEYIIHELTKIVGGTPTEGGAS